jgi:hypothetical protein
MIKERSITRGWLTVASGKLLAQVDTINGRWIELGEAPKRRGNEAHLHHIGATVDTGGHVQTNAGLCKDR